jgi:hypothetical protein
MGFYWEGFFLLSTLNTLNSRGIGSERFLVTFRNIKIVFRRKDYFDAKTFISATFIVIWYGTKVVVPYPVNWKADNKGVERYCSGTCQNIYRRFYRISFIYVFWSVMHSGIKIQIRVWIQIQPNVPDSFGFASVADPGCFIPDPDP